MTIRKKLVYILCSALLVALVISFCNKFFLKLYYPQKYHAIIELETQENDLPRGLVYAVIHTESRFRPHAVSNVGARGLMQITEDTFEWIKYRMGDETTTYEDLFRPETNIKYGAKLLNLLIEEFGSVETALCAYHAGWGNTKNWLQNPEYSADGMVLHKIPFADTAHYQSKVLNAWQHYVTLYQ